MRGPETEQLIATGRGRVAAAIIVADGRVLLIRRAQSDGQLSWQFPAGKVETRESDDQAAVREALEETGLTVRAVGNLGNRIHPETGRAMSYVACELVSGTARAASQDEVEEVAWCDRAEVAAKIPYSIFSPVQDYLDVMLHPP